MNYEYAETRVACAKSGFHERMPLHVLVADSWELMRHPLGKKMIEGKEYIIHSAYMKCESCGFVVPVNSLIIH